MPLRCPRYRHKPGLLRKNPCKCNLGWRRVLPLSDGAEQVYQRPVGLPRLRRETGYSVAEIGAVERCVLVDLAREITLAQRAERNKADSELFENRNDLRLRLPPPERILALQR